MPESEELVAKLKQADPDVQQYVAALKLELKKVHSQNIKLEGQNASLEARIDAIKDNNPSPEDLPSAQELEDKIVQAARDLGYELTKVKNLQP